LCTQYNNYCVAPTTPPGSFSGSSLSAYEVSLSWTALPLIDVNGNLIHYVIDASEVDTSRQFQSTSLTTSAIIRSLHPYYTYKFRVAAVTNAVGVYSPYIRIRTDESGK